MDVCQVTCVDAGRVRRARASMPPEGAIGDLAETFRVLADPGRIRLLQALAVTELCVCDLATLLGASSSAVSHQLRLLRAARLVRYRKEGKMTYYALDDDHIRALLAEGLRHVEEEKGATVQGWGGDGD